MRTRLWHLLMVLLPGICLPPVSAGAEESGEPNYSCYREILSGYVCSAGVDYRGLQQSGLLDRCLGEFRLAREEYSGISESGKIAYLINLYNFYTLRLISENYPLKSIRDLRNPWKRDFVPFFGESVSLDHIEHKILRKDFDEPRIHFAVNCASIGCPPLREEPFTGKGLEAQLHAAARSFLAEGERNRVGKGTLYLSRIFDWYGDDFKKKYGGYRNYVQDVLALQGKYEVKFLDYDWGLNDSPACGK